MLAVSLVQVAFGGRGLLRARTAMAFGRDLPGSPFRAGASVLQREFGHFGTPSLITRTTNDVQQVQMLALLAFTLMVAAPIMGVGSILAALNQNVPLSALLLVVVPLLGAIVIAPRLQDATARSGSMQGRIDRINQVLREQITGVRVIRAFVRDDSRG